MLNNNEIRAIIFLFHKQSLSDYKNIVKQAVIF